MSARYTYEQFVTAWRDSKSVGEVAEKLQVSKFTVERVARLLRKKGLDLPTMRTNPLHSEPDIEALGKLLRGDG